MSVEDTIPQAQQDSEKKKKKKKGMGGYGTGDKTDKMPRPKTSTRANFCLRGNFNDASMGMGMTTTQISVTICKAALRYQMGLRGRQRLKPGSGFQKSDTGMQNRNELRVIQRPTTETTTRLTMVMMR